MKQNSWSTIIEQLRKFRYHSGVRDSQPPKERIDFAAGLTAAEVLSAESCFEFSFPPDLKEFLQTALPKGRLFPDWRSGDESTLRDWLNVPRDGILFDIEHSGFWFEKWGPRPTSLAESLEFAAGLIKKAPKLIPIHSHRMMPEEPKLVGNPVFSVHQSDIIYYGFDLADYLRHEFGLPGREPWPEQIRPIPFWDIDGFQEV